jgi:hypothetical protein
MSEEIERLLKEFVEDSRLSERVARLEERARIEDRDQEHNFRTQSGSWDLEAILAAQRAKKKSTIPPGLRAISTMMDSAGGKVGALVAAAAVTWLVEHLPAIVRALH